MLAGAAPIPASSGQVSRVRLNRGDHRQLNRALFSIAFAQVRTYPPSQAFVARKRAEGPEASPCPDRLQAPQRSRSALVLEGLTR